MRGHLARLHLATDRPRWADPPRGRSRRVSTRPRRAPRSAPRQLRRYRRWRLSETCADSRRLRGRYRRPRDRSFWRPQELSCTQSASGHKMRRCETPGGGALYTCASTLRPSADEDYLAHVDSPSPAIPDFHLRLGDRRTRRGIHRRGSATRAHRTTRALTEPAPAAAPAPAPATASDPAPAQALATRNCAAPAQLLRRSRRAGGTGGGQHLYGAPGHRAHSAQCHRRVVWRRPASLSPATGTEPGFRRDHGFAPRT